MTHAMNKLYLSHKFCVLIISGGNYNFESFDISANMLLSLITVTNLEANIFT